MKIIRKFLHWTRWPLSFLSEYQWYRRLHGGYWANCMVDWPVCSVVWCDVAAEDFNQHGESYREPLWRGKPDWEHWP